MKINPKIKIIFYTTDIFVLNLEDSSELQNNISKKLASSYDNVEGKIDFDISYKSPLDDYSLCKNCFVILDIEDESEINLEFTEQDKVAVIILSDLENRNILKKIQANNLSVIACFQKPLDLEFFSDIISDFYITNYLNSNTENDYNIQDEENEPKKINDREDESLILNLDIETSDDIQIDSDFEMNTDMDLNLKNSSVKLTETETEFDNIEESEENVIDGGDKEDIDNVLDFHLEDFDVEEDFSTIEEENKVKEKRNDDELEVDTQEENNNNEEFDAEQGIDLDTGINLEMDVSQNDEENTSVDEEDVTAELDILDIGLTAAGNEKLEVDRKEENNNSEEFDTEQGIDLDTGINLEMDVSQNDEENNGVDEEDVTAELDILDIGLTAASNEELEVDRKEENNNSEEFDAEQGIDLDTGINLEMDVSQNDEENNGVDEEDVTAELDILDIGLNAASNEELEYDTQEENNNEELDILESNQKNETENENDPEISFSEDILDEPLQSYDKVDNNDVEEIIDEYLKDDVPNDEKLNQINNIELEKLLKLKEEEIRRLNIHMDKLTEDRNLIIVENQKLISQNISINRSNLNLKNELDEYKIELKVLQNRKKEDYESLKLKLEQITDLNQMLTEKYKIIKEKFELVRSKSFLDVQRTKQHEKELESKLELMSYDTSSQIKKREEKILELKQTVDQLEFNMKNLLSSEQKIKMENVNLQAKLDRMLHSLKGSLRNFESNQIVKFEE